MCDIMSKLIEEMISSKDAELVKKDAEIEALKKALKESKT